MPRPAATISRASVVTRSGRYLGAALMILAASGLARVAAEGSRWGKDYLPNLPVTTQTGESLRFYDDVVKGKIVVISFIYTSCRDICPVVTARMAQVQDKLGDVVGREVFFISISIDPVNDTPSKLKEYADAFQAGQGWLFLTGKTEDIDVIRYKLGERSRRRSEHGNTVILYNDTTGEWSRDSAFSDLNLLALNIRAMDPALRDRIEPEAERTSVATQVGNAGGGSHNYSLPGQALFTKTCAGCHTIGRGDRVGPDLKGLASRRTRDWIVSYITRPEKLRSRKDRTAIALANKYKAIRMPNLSLSTNDANDVIAYIEAMTYAGAPRPKP
jgi:protein SCO1